MDPPRFDIGRVEPPAGQGTEHRHFCSQSFGGDRPGAAVHPGMDTLARASGPPAR